MKVYKTNTSKRRDVLQSASSLGGNLKGLAAAWNAFGYGEFSMQYLGDALATEGRTVAAPATNGCKSCAGMLQFSSGQTYLEEFLLDQMGSNAMVGGVKLSRQKLCIFRWMLVERQIW